MAIDRAHEPSRLVAEIGEAERSVRRRLADDLHDGVLQRLLAARQDLDEARDGDAAALDELGVGLDRIAVELRHLTSAMHEDILDDLPLREALQRIVSDASDRGRFVADIELDDAAAGLHDAVVRDVVRELVANVARHAAATAAHVSVRRCSGVVEIVVRDDGVGYDEQKARAAEREGHVGLVRLRRLAGELGGRTIVGPAVPRGTLVVVELPELALAAQLTLEEELREERRWSAALVGALQDGLVVVRRGVIVQVNEAFCAMTGFTRDELMGAGLPHPFWPERHARQLEAFGQRAIDTGSAEDVVSLQRVDGSMLPTVARIARLDDEAGILVLVKDLTDRERSEGRARTEDALRTAIGTTHRLAGLDAARQGGRDAVLAEIGAVLAYQLGWGDVVINLRDGDQYRVAWTSQAELEAALGGATYAMHELDSLLDERFQRRGAFIVPAEEQTAIVGPVHVPAQSPPQHPRAWDAASLLLIPMASASDTPPLGILSVDHPLSGLAPTDEMLDLLVAVAAHGAAVLARLDAD